MLDIALNAHVPLKLICGHFGRNQVSFRVIKYDLNTTRNEMPTYVHQNIGLFLNVTKMKCHVNRTCFHAGLKFQAGMTSFRHLGECILTKLATVRNLRLNKFIRML